MKRIAGGLFALVLIFAAAWGGGLRANFTPSFPLGLYLVRGDWQRGDLVFACLPESVAAGGRERGYLPAGFCPGDVTPVLKRVAAIAGDTVTRDGGGLSVNGAAIPNSAALAADSKGLALVAWRPEPIADDSVLLLSDYNLKSWDSRYFGPVAAGGIIGMARPVLVWD